MYMFVPMWNGKTMPNLKVDSWMDLLKPELKGKMSILDGSVQQSTALAYWLWQVTLQSLDVSKAAAFSFLVPIIGVSIGALFFSEPLTINVIGGGALAAIGIYLASRPRSETSPLMSAKKEA